MTESSDLAHDVLATIRRIVRRVSEHSKQLSKDVGLTVPQLVTLKAIGEGDGGGEALSVAGLATKVHLSPATVSRIVDRLVRGGLVVRERGVADRRLVWLRLSEKGEERFAALPTPLQETFLERLRALPDEERRSLLASLQRIAELMGAADLDASPVLTPEAEVEES